MDANLNRAREGLRVMEDYARFSLNDAGLTALAKKLRHELAEAVRETLGLTLIRSRNILDDVGTALATEDEYTRRSPRDVAVAAGKRLSESLRVLEEYGKTFDIDFARRMERLRYRGYELERRLAMTGDAVARFGGVRLYVILTEAHCRTGWYETAVAAIEGGADAIQLREKQLSDRVLLDRIRKLSGLCRERDVLLIVNDRPDLAVIGNASGVHVGQDDLDVTSARRICGTDRLVGVSTHSIDQVVAAAEAVPDYIALGPIFDTALKPGSIPLGCAAVAEAVSRTAIPIVPIGGIDERGAVELAGAGARCVCVCRSVIAQTDAADAARSLKKAFEPLR